jgi:hypothetical protein
MTNDRPALSSETTRQDDLYCKDPTRDLTSGHESRTGLDTKTDRQPQCDFDSDIPCPRLFSFPIMRFVRRNGQS